jgi:hypothetical protein
MFAIMLAVLVWESNNSVKFRRFQYLCFCSMSFALVASGVGFPATLLLQRIINIGWLHKSSFLFAPMGTAALVGLCVGLLVGGRILSERLYGYRAVSPKSRLALLRDGLIIACVAGIIEELVNRERIDPYFPSEMAGFALGGAYIALSGLNRFAVGRQG